MCRPALRAPFGPCTAWELQHACSTGDVRLHGLPRVLAVDDDASLLLMPCMPMCGFCRRLPACMPKGGVIPLHAIVPLVYILLNNLFFFLVRSCYIHIPTSVHLGFRTSTHASHHHIRTSACFTSPQLCYIPKSVKRLDAKAWRCCSMRMSVFAAAHCRRMRPAGVGCISCLPPHAFHRLPAMCCTLKVLHAYTSCDERLRVR